MSNSLMDHFARVEDLLAAEPEDVGEVVLRMFHAHKQNSGVTTDIYVSRVYPLSGHSEYDEQHRNEFELAVIEAFSWLIRQGLFVRAPGPNRDWFTLSRRARSLKLERLREFRMAGVLPVELLQPSLKAKVWPLFLRGDHDVAVFQAFKEVEVAVRNACNTKVGNVPDDEVGASLMRRAFNPQNGPLTNVGLVPSEREAEAHLFAGAMGHGKNPVSHRDILVSSEEAARLIVFASHLLSLVAKR